MAAIETTHLKKYYGKTRGIEDVTLSVDEGEIFGFIGPNGAGKSTTIRTLLNFIFPTGGEARVLGLDPVSESKQIRAQVGYLPAEVGYYEDMTVRALLEYSAEFYAMDDVTTKRRIGDLAATFELDIARKAHTLSTGNRKKVGICLALLHSPRLLILDEPTAGLDPLMQRRLLEVLADENRRGATVFFSSHVLSEVQQFCHRVAILKDGKVLRTEEIGRLRTGQFLKVRATFAPGDAPDSLGVPGAIHEHRENHTLELLYNGDINVLIRQLGNHRLVTLALEEPPLEEIFMRYYERGGETQ